MKYIVCALCLVVLTTTAFAEEVTRNAGDKSINFSLSRADLQEYKYGIGAKYWTSSSTALSASIDLSNNKTETNNPTSGPLHTTYDSSYYAFSVAAEHHFLTDFRLSPYIGGELKYSRYESDSANIYASTSYHYGSSEKTYSAGILVGAEYALNKAVSLAGEYAYGFSYSSRDYQNDYGVETGRSRGFNLSVGRLTLLLYF